MNAVAASYVTAEALQRRYPARQTAFTTNYSSVHLPSNAFVSGPRNLTVGNRPIILINVGSMEQLYKGQEVLLKSVARCVDLGMDLGLLLVGDGKYRRRYQTLAMQLGIGDRVTFVGQVGSARAVRGQLDRADVFVSASRQEGLPRALLEAMARGLPCIATDVGGVSELLPHEDLVDIGDVPALANKVREVVKDTSRMRRMAVRNLEKSREYEAGILQARRIEFYRYIEDATTTWLNRGGG